MSLVTKSNLTEGSDHKILNGQVVVGSHAQAYNFLSKRLIFALSQSCASGLAHLRNARSDPLFQTLEGVTILGGAHHLVNYPVPCFLPPPCHLS